MTTSEPAARAAKALTQGEVLMVVKQHIGIDGGYLGIDDGHLGRFTYATLDEFFPEYCDVEGVDTYAFGGTSRDRFVGAVLALGPGDQAKVLSGVLNRFPVTTTAAHRTESSKKILALIERLNGARLVSGGDLNITSAAVRGALEDAETLLREHGPVRAIDRMHTILHAYLRAACDDTSLEYNNLTSVQGLLKKLEREHPKLANLGARPQEVTTILNSLGTIAGALDPIRNNATLAHANTELLGAPEAVLVINTVRAIYSYLDAKFG
jgi:hypothetical protein